MRGYPCDCLECGANNLGTCGAAIGEACDEDIIDDEDYDVEEKQQ